MKENLKENDFKIPDTTCPKCGHRFTHAAFMAGPDDEPPVPPEEGDLNMCFGCTEILVFNEDLSLRLQTPEEFLDLDLDTRHFLLKMREAHAITMKKLEQDAADRPVVE